MIPLQCVMWVVFYPINLVHCLIYLYIFGARETSLFLTRVAYMSGVSLILANDCHVLLKSGICPDLRVHYFLAFIAILFLYLLLFHICLFIIINLLSKEKCAIYHCLLLSTINPLHVLCLALMFSFLRYFCPFIPCCDFRSITLHFTWSQWSKYTYLYIYLHW